ncbi:MAG: chemotaxis protein CheW [Nitrospinae bacterium]|nr:chemotaxis protein CheW [Nitrospinota bacterium]
MSTDTLTRDNDVRGGVQKYLTFVLGHEEYGLEILKVREIISVVVDTVAEVLDIHENDIDPPPSFGTAVRTDFILGMGKVKGKVKILLDIEKVLSEQELEAAVAAA